MNSHRQCRQVVEQPCRRGQRSPTKMNWEMALPTAIEAPRAPLRWRLFLYINEYFQRLFLALWLVFAILQIVSVHKHRGHLTSRSTHHDRTKESRWRRKKFSALAFQAHHQRHLRSNTVGLVCIFSRRGIDRRNRFSVLGDIQPSTSAR